MNALLTAAQTVADHLDIWAAPEPTGTPQPTGEVNTSGIIGWLVKAIIPILLGGIGVLFVAKSGKGRVSEILTSTAIVIIGLIFVAGAVVLPFVGDYLINVMFN